MRSWWSGIEIGQSSNTRVWNDGAVRQRHWRRRPRRCRCRDRDGESQRCSELHVVSPGWSTVIPRPSTGRNRQKRLRAPAVARGLHFRWTLGAAENKSPHARRNTSTECDDFFPCDAWGGHYPEATCSEQAESVRRELLGQSEELDIIGRTFQHEFSAITLPCQPFARFAFAARRRAARGQRRAGARGDDQRHREALPRRQGCSCRKSQPAIAAAAIRGSSGSRRCARGSAASATISSVYPESRSSRCHADRPRPDREPAAGTRPSTPPRGPPRTRRRPSRSRPRRSRTSCATRARPAGCTPPNTPLHRGEQHARRIHSTTGPWRDQRAIPAAAINTQTTSTARRDPENRDTGDRRTQCDREAQRNARERDRRRGSSCPARGRTGPARATAPE